MIELHNVTKRFHSLVAVKDISFTIPRGEVMGILGPNGAGKTTLFKLIAGILQPDGGQLQSIQGGWPAIGYKPERLLFPNQMRVAAYLRMVAALANVPAAEIDTAVHNSLTRVNLLEAAGKRISDCSKGMRQRLGLAQVLIGDPPFILLDEPSNGLDPEGQAEICRQIELLHEQGKTILLASHQLHEVTQVCTHLVILNNGAVHYQNSMEAALAERPHVAIRVDRPPEQMADLLKSLHPDIDISETTIFLNQEALHLRRQVLSILLAAGFDILELVHKHVTLAEIYAEAIR